MLLSVFGEPQVPPRTGKPGRPAGPRVVPPLGMCYATVHKKKENNRVVGANSQVVFGTSEQVEQTLEESGRSRAVRGWSARESERC